MLYETKQCGRNLEVKLYDTFSLSDTLLSGQTFRWVPYKNGFRGIVGNRICVIEQEGDRLIFRNCSEDEFEGFWKGYFGFDVDYKSIRDTLCYDKNVVKAMDAYGGIHIMRQPLWETVISFIISANNNIPRIMGIIDRLSTAFGKKCSSEFGDYYTFPTPEALNNATVEELHACGTGYRDVYIKKTAEAFATHSFDTELLYELSYPEAKKHIMTLCGVGPKVADCILLFAAGKENAFPVDVWVKKIVCRLYLTDKDEKTVSVKEIERFATEHFPRYAGYAQQVLFHYIRNNE